MPLPQINLDAFDRKTMFEALQNYGTYELVGPSIDALRPLAERALANSKELLSLPLETLKKHPAKDFNGFDDVRGKSILSVENGNSKTVRNQIAFHFKPYLESKIPDGIDATAINDYYKAAHEILIKHYQQIADAFIDPDFHPSVPDFTQDKKSVLMMRRYFADTAGIKTEKLAAASTTGIPSHSDHGRITLVTADQAGLEVYKDGEWIAATSIPGTLQFFINFGDWSLFQCLCHSKSGEKPPFEAGLHRVPEVAHERHSMSLSLNPPVNEKVLTPTNKVLTFETFLQSDKAIARDTSRDKSASDVADKMAALRPVISLPVPKNTPELHVLESTDADQESWVQVKGKGPVLCDNKLVGHQGKVKTGYSYAYPSITAAHQTKLPNVHQHNPRSFSVKLQNAADVFVVDEAVFNTKQSHEEVANTAVPLVEYQGQFTQPVYLIQRPLLIDEAQPTYLEQNNHYAGGLTK